VSRGCQVRWFAKNSPLIFWNRELFFLRAIASYYNNAKSANMPKSKRQKVVHLTKTDKKGKELSQKLFANVQEAADKFEHVFVFAVENMRNSYLKAVRAEFADSRYDWR
jgi:5S rRNA maturation endonuclease (ribonuclease M5)